MLEFIIELTEVLIWIFGVANIIMFVTIGAHTCWLAGQKAREDAEARKQFDLIVRQ